MNSKTLYLECYSGISGDMTVASLLDLGADQEVLLEGLKSLHVDGYKIEIGRRSKCGIDACDFDVILDANLISSELHHSHDSNETHIHSHTHDNNESHIHSHIYNDNDSHIHSHTHDNNHSHNHILLHDHNHENEPLKVSSEHHAHLHLGHHEHRNLYEINTIIEQSSITANAKEIAKKIFHIVAVAESKAHRKPIEEVHFHEVGAIDSIVDIVATAICLDNLSIKEVIVTELYEGTGHIPCQHGILPVPVPAVVNIATEHHIPLHITSVKGELVTPTGAAIVAAIRTKHTLPKEFNIVKVGLGAGKREYEQASFVRAMIIEEKTTTINQNSTMTDKVWVLEANIDDCSGEVLSVAMDLLFQHGAKDVYYTPIYMKKNRPAYLLGVICEESSVEKMEEIIFTHTTTIGIRKHEDIRTILKREIKNVITPYGEAKVKVCTYGDKTFYYPEYESIKELCDKSNLDYKTIYELIQNSIRNPFTGLLKMF